MNRQSGAVLLAALIVVALLAFLSVSFIYRTQTSQQLVMAYQDRAATEQVAKNVIEYVLSDVDNLIVGGFDPSTLPTALISGYNITVGAPECVHAQPASGYSLTQPIVPETVYWQVAVSVSDDITGAQSSYTQLVKFNYTAGSCD
jgi:hypothetical protein